MVNDAKILPVQHLLRTLAYLAAHMQRFQCSLRGMGMCDLPAGARVACWLMHWPLQACQNGLQGRVAAPLWRSHLRWPAAS